VKLQVVGSRAELSSEIVKLIENAEELTKDNTALTLTIALNYGGRHEIMQAAADYARYCVDNNIEPDFESAEEHFPSFMMTAGLPDPDILIRPGGEQRISNFLLWQSAYTEFVFTDTLWPDFSRADLEIAVSDFAGRERRFGAVIDG